MQFFNGIDFISYERNFESGNLYVFHFKKGIKNRLEEYIYIYIKRGIRNVLYTAQGISLYGRDYAGNGYYNISRLYGKASGYGLKASSQKHGELETQATT